MRLKVLLLCSALLLVGMTSAFSTTIIVNTAPNYSLMASLYEPGKAYPSIESFYKTSNEDGRAMITFDISQDQYNLYLALRDPVTGDYNLKHERFDELLNSGEDHEVNFYPEWYHIESGIVVPGSSTEAIIIKTSNETQNTTAAPAENGTQNTVNTTNSSNSEIKKDVTALSISDNISIKGSTIYYILGIVVLALIIFLIIRWRKRESKEPPQIKVKKFSEMKQEQNDDLKTQEEKVEQTRNMLREEEERLKRLRNPNLNKIEEAKRKLIEDEKELMRLRRENSGNQ